MKTKTIVTFASLLAGTSLSHAAIALIDFSNAAVTTTAGWDVIGVSGKTGSAANVPATALGTG